MEIKSISVTPEDAQWLSANEVNTSRFVRRAIRVCREYDNQDIENLVQKLQVVNKKLNELLAAYQMDKTVKQDVV